MGPDASPGMFLFYERRVATAHGCGTGETRSSCRIAQLCKPGESARPETSRSRLRRARVTPSRIWREICEPSLPRDCAAVYFGEWPAGLLRFHPLLSRPLESRFMAENTNVLLLDAESLQNMMVSIATGGSEKEAEFERLTATAPAVRQATLLPQHAASQDPAQRLRRGSRRGAYCMRKPRLRAVAQGPQEG